MTILIDPFHRNKRCPELNPELFVVSLVFTFNPQSRADGAGFYDVVFYDVVVPRICPLYVLVSCMLPL